MPKIARICACLAALACCPSALALDEEVLTDVIDSARAEMRMPGLRAAVRYPDGRVVRAASGLADKEAGKPLDNDVGMPGGSTGKVFAAALTMLLVEDGTLSLDDPVEAWLGDQSWFQKVPNADTMLVRHLLSHSSGIGDYPGKVRFNFAMVRRVIRNGSAYFTPEELIAYAGKKPRFDAGNGYAYSDAGYLLLGRVIEAATGTSYFDLLRERILVPHGLHDIHPQVQSVLPNITPGYQGGVSNLKDDGRMKLDPRSEWTGGGLVTTPTMLVEFLGALAEGRIVNDASLALMLESGWKDPDGASYHYGFGLFVDDSGEWIGHDGLWVGYRTQVTHLLQSGVTIAVQTNRDGRVDLVGLVTEIAELIESDSSIQSRTNSR